MSSEKLAKGGSFSLDSGLSQVSGASSQLARAYVETEIKAITEARGEVDKLRAERRADYEKEIKAFQAWFTETSPVLNMVNSL